MTSKSSLALEQNRLSGVALSLIRIEVPGSFLNLRETVSGNVRQGSSGLVGDQGEVPKKVGQPVLKFFALFGSTIDASSCGHPLKQRADFARFLMEAAERKVYSILIIPQ